VEKPACWQAELCFSFIVRIEMKKRYVEVVMDLPIERVFHYSLPGELEEKAEIGKRVLVPLGKRKEVGFLLKFIESPEVKKVKDVLKILDEVPVFDEELLELGKWMAEYYLCSLGQALAAVSPPLLRSFPSTDSSLPGRKRPPCPGQLPSLSGYSSTTLLQGERRKEVYLKAITQAIKKKRGVIFLLPEISLTSGVIGEFKSQFEERVAILHSRLPARERYKEWRRIKEGEVSIVVGTRLALFAPFSNLGLIIIDGEEDPSYKQEENPRYWSGEVAIRRAKKKGAVVLLGSATPSLESYYKASRGEYKLIKLTSEKEEREVKIIDMRKEPEGIILSRSLRKAMEEALQKKEKIILLLNRRGFASFLLCRDCGKVLLCPNCLVSLTYHFKDKNMYCHYCNYEEKAPSFCPNCQGYYLRYFGIGTEKVEEEVKNLFPRARTLRIDRDTVPRKYSRNGDSQEALFSAFQKGEIDILIGTRMVLKGLDFSRVALAGVIASDTSLHFPDFRAAERTFRLLSQVIRRGNSSRQVIIQTYDPESHALSAAEDISYEDFYKKEISARKELKYPPFSRLVRIIIRGLEEEKVKKTALSLGKILLKSLPFRQAGAPDGHPAILGPAPCPLTKLKGKYRWHIIIKDTSLNLSPLLKSSLNSFPISKKLDLIVDPDPLAML
jgi:primosomal protein N' (replication factor Y)